MSKSKFNVVEFFAKRLSAATAQERIEARAALEKLSSGDDNDAKSAKRVLASVQLDERMGLSSRDVAAPHFERPASTRFVFPTRGK